MAMTTSGKRVPQRYLNDVIEDGDEDGRIFIKTTTTVPRLQPLDFSAMATSAKSNKKQKTSKGDNDDDDGCYLPQCLIGSFWNENDIHKEINRFGKEQEGGCTYVVRKRVRTSRADAENVVFWCKQGLNQNSGMCDAHFTVRCTGDEAYILPKFSKIGHTHKSQERERLETFKYGAFREIASISRQTAEEMRQEWFEDQKGIMSAFLPGMNPKTNQRGVTDKLSVHDNGTEKTIFDFCEPRSRRQGPTSVKRVLCLGYQDFQGRLKNEDVPYAKWWIGKRMKGGGGGGGSGSNDYDIKGDKTLVFLLVNEADPVTVQKSLLFMNDKYGIFDSGGMTNGYFAHAVFRGRNNETLLAIDKYFLRNYRMMTIRYIKTQNAAPVAPLYTQFWALRPRDTTKMHTRRFGMYATIVFIATEIKESSSIHHVYKPHEQLFQIYDWLPEFISFFHPNDEEMYKCLYYSVCLKRREENSLYGLLGAFLFQRAIHILDTPTLKDLMGLFGISDSYAEKRKRTYPYAYAIVRHLMSRVGTNDMVHVSVGSWKDLDIPKGVPIPPDKSVPACYYLYELCFDKDLFPEDVRHKLAFGMTIPRITPTSTNVNGDGANRKGARRGGNGFIKSHDELLKDYERNMTKLPSHAGTASRYVPFSDSTSDLWPLRGLMLLLQGLDHMRDNVPPDQTGKYTSIPTITREETLGKLHLDDPVLFATSEKNMAITSTRKMNTGRRNTFDSSQLIYFDDSLWVAYCGTAWDKLTQLEVAILDATVLVRDPAFYANVASENKKKENLRK